MKKYFKTIIAVTVLFLITSAVVFVSCEKNNSTSKDVIENNTDNLESVYTLDQINEMFMPDALTALNMHFDSIAGATHVTTLVATRDSVCDISKGIEHHIVDVHYTIGKYDFNKTVALSLSHGNTDLIVGNVMLWCECTWSIDWGSDNSCNVIWSSNTWTCSAPGTLTGIDCLACRLKAVFIQPAGTKK